MNEHIPSYAIKRSEVPKEVGYRFIRDFLNATMSNGVETDVLAMHIQQMMAGYAKSPHPIFPDRRQNGLETLHASLAEKPITLAEQFAITEFCHTLLYECECKFLHPTEEVLT